MDKISSETELSVSDPSEKKWTCFSSHSTYIISSIQNNPSTCSFLPSLSYKSLSLSSILESKKLIVEIEEDNNIGSNIKIQALSPQ